MIQQDSNYQSRNYSIELLRILLMSLIVFGHLLLFGIGGGKYNEDGSPSLCALLQPLYLYHVDAFVFISGYYGINLRWNRFGELILKMLVYSIFAYFFSLCISTDIRFSISGLIKNIYPISACDWWFMAQYLYLMLMAPFINEGVGNISQKQFCYLLVALYILSFRGFSCLLLFVYVWGRYMRLYPIEWVEKHASKIFILTIMLFEIINLILLHYHIYITRLYEYMSPFCLIPGTAIFYIFKKMEVKRSWIITISSGVLVSYLVTTHQIMQVPFHKWIISWGYDNVFFLLIVAPFIVIIFSILDQLLSLFFVNVKKYGKNKIHR